MIGPDDIVKQLESAIEQEGSTVAGRDVSDDIATVESSMASDKATKIQIDTAIKEYYRGGLAQFENDVAIAEAAGEELTPVLPIIKEMMDYCQTEFTRKHPGVSFLPIDSAHYNTYIQDPHHTMYRYLQKAPNLRKTAATYMGPVRRYPSKLGQIAVFWKAANDEKIIQSMQTVTSPHAKMS